jgi:ribonucleoside-diphosphate reductase alpha chain
MSELSANARRVLEARYLARNQAGRAVESYPDLCRRVARGVAAAEEEFGGETDRIEEAFHRLLLSREFLPNSPTLMNAGTPCGQLAACFVLPIDDSMDGIFEAVKRMAVIHQLGGGTGFSFTGIRPRGDLVGGVPGIAAGPVAFLGVFDAATAAVKQGGRRRGANMGVMRVDHPDVLEFVRAKVDPGSITNFNLSVGVTDPFMEAASTGKRFDLVNPRDGRVVGSLDARALLGEMAERAWAGGDPGVIFLDAVNRDNPTPRLGVLQATNPCGELPLLADESCNLGSIRLDAFVRGGLIDWERLDATTDLAVRFLDDVIEVSEYPFAEVARASLGSRKIGLGVMGFADLLVDLGIPYDSTEAAMTAERVMERIRSRARRASAELARERGVFPNFAGSTAEAAGERLRNATVTSIAPTGTLSIIAGCSGGIEPYFALAFVRHVLDGERLPETNLRFEAALRRAGAWSELLVEQVRRTGSVRDNPAVPEQVRRLFPIAAEIGPSAHLEIQAAFQRHVDNAVSKTINLPNSASVQEVEEIYTDAWRRGLKGVTVFREDSKGVAVLRRGTGGHLEASADFTGPCNTERCD